MANFDINVYIIAHKEKYPLYKWIKYILYWLQKYMASLASE